MIHLLFSLIFFFFGDVVYAQRTPMNIFLPLDPFVIPYEITQGQDIQVSFYGESGVKNGHSFDNKGHTRNPLQLWDASENAVTMLNDSPPGSEQERIRNQIAMLTNPNSGKIIFHGEFKEKFGGVIGIRKNIYDFFCASLLIPYYGVALTNVHYQDLTPTNTVQDQLIHELITDNLVANVKKWGNLDLTPWSRNGFGDVTAQLEWHKHFPQHRPLLQEVTAHLHAGITFPTGKKLDPDSLIAFSFGNNGGLAIPFGAALDLQLGSYVHVGIDVLLMHTFSTVLKERIKTSETQTSLLLLQKAENYVDFGLTQRFLLYGQLSNIIPHVSCTLWYHYLKQGEDEMVVRGNQFLTSIAQNTLIFEDRTMHHVIFTFDYNRSFSPVDFAISFVARFPFKGKRVLSSPTMGGSISLAF